MGPNKDAMQWADEKFPLPNANADNIELERYLRDICVKGASYRMTNPSAKYHKRGLPIGVRRAIGNTKAPNHYLRYFLCHAKPKEIGKSVAAELAQRGGIQYTNEMQYATVLKAFVSDRVYTASVRFLQQHGVDGF
ncbi:hypothetical protein V6X62_01575 [Spiribacter sp. 218]|uniref:hypothetical protein n=1 Tax=Spiribacter pallidus TaxID=1987936 RepID=UPI00349F1A0D